MIKKYFYILNVHVICGGIRNVRRRNFEREFIFVAVSRLTGGSLFKWTFRALRS